MSDFEHYLEIVRRCPDLFRNPPGAGITIELEPEKVRTIEQVMEKELVEQKLPGEWAQVGVAYEDQYMLILRDAVYLGDGKPGTYIRFVSEKAVPGVIILPVLHDRIVLLNHFRHATRTWHLEIPRGFGLPDLTGEENARRELEEEISAQATQLLPLGRAYADTGMSMEYNEFFLARIESYGERNVSEGISEIRQVSLTEFERLLRDDEITDSFTLIAYARAKLRGLL